MDLAHLVAGVFLVVAAATPRSASVDEVVQHVQRRFDATLDFTVST